MYRIFTPDPHFTGERSGVLIVAGQGLTADRIAAEDCRRLGYQVTEEPPVEHMADQPIPIQPSRRGRPSTAGKRRS